MKQGIKLMQKLKEVFPEKYGEEQAWNFRKFYDIVHASMFIMFSGWLETTSCKSGELAQTNLLKSLAGNINNYNVFIQFLRYWERFEQLARAGRVAAGDDVDDEGQGEELPGSSDDRARDEAMHAFELGT